MTHFLAALLTATSLAGEPEALYSEGNYQAAVGAYQELIEAGERHGDLYYNLGNSYYRLGELGEAIAAWKQAALLQPRSGEIQANLELARSARAEGGSSLGPEGLLPLRFVLSLQEQVYLTLLLATLAGLSHLLRSRGSAWLLRRRLFLSLSVLTGVLVSLESWSQLTKTQAVVVSPSVTVRSAAGAGGELLFQLPEGSELRLEQRLGERCQIADPERGRGWMTCADLARVQSWTAPPDGPDSGAL